MGSQRGKQNFVCQYLAGKVGLEEIDNFIDAWHDGDSKEALHEYLGLSRAEYAFYIEKPDMLSNIIKEA